jgi:hypothetical protein
VAAQLPQYLDPGEVPVVEVAVHPRLECPGAVGETEFGIQVDLHQQDVGEVADGVRDPRVNGWAVGDRRVEREPAAPAPHGQGFRVRGEQHGGRGQAELRAACFQPRPRLGFQPQHPRGEPGTGDRRRRDPQRQRRRGRQVVEPVEPVGARPPGRCLAAGGLHRGDERLERRPLLRLGQPLAVVGPPPVAEDQEPADRVGGKAVQADVQNHPVLGEDRHAGVHQRCPVRGQEQV